MRAPIAAIALGSACWACTPSPSPPAPSVVSVAPGPRASSEPDPAPQPPSELHERPHVDVTTARSAALAVFLRFVDKSFADPALDPAADAPSCDAGPCEWVFTGSAAFDGERGPLALLHVDATSGKVEYEPNDGKNKRWDPEVYAAYLDGSDKAIAAVTALPEVKRLCAALDKKGVHCQLWIEESSDEPCSEAPDLAHPCLWSVYLGERHPTHTARIASVAVAPGKWSVVGGSTLACDRMPLASFSKHLRALAAGTAPPACP